MTEIPIITAIVYTILVAYKEVIRGNVALTRITPLIAAFLGMGIGILAYLTIPEYTTSREFFQAIYHGVIAGLAATGVNQVFKQLNKPIE